MQIQVSLFHIVIFGVALAASLSVALEKAYLLLVTQASMSFQDPYDKFMLFGDSLFQHSTSQDRGFGLTPALQFGKFAYIAESHKGDSDEQYQQS